MRYSDHEAEQCLLIMLIREPIHAHHCYPAMFSSDILKKAFIYSKGKDFLVEPLTIANALDFPDDSSRAFFRDELEYVRYKHKDQSINCLALIKYLKELMFKRIVLDRTEDMITALDERDTSHTLSKLNQAMRKITILQANFNKKRFSAEVVARLTAEKINSMKDLVLTGLPFIDKRLNGLTRKSISSLIAKPKHLKSTLVDFMVSTSVEKYNTVGLILSLEDPIEERVKRICASRLEVSLEDMRFKRVSVSEVDILNIFKHNFKNRLYIYDKKDVLTPDDAAMIINEIKPDLVVIDYIQKFVMDDMVLGIIRAVNTLESVAIQNNSNIMVLSQVSDKKIVGREDQAPTASDAQWSSAMYQSSSEMFGLYYPHVHTKNPFDMNILEFNILASRYAHVSGKFKIKVNPDKGFIGDEITHESN